MWICMQVLDSDCSRCMVVAGVSRWRREVSEHESVVKMSIAGKIR